MRNKLLRTRPCRGKMGNLRTRERFVAYCRQLTHALRVAYVNSYNRKASLNDRIYQSLYNTVAGHFAERHFAERHFAERTICRKTFCRTDYLPNGLFAKRPFCRQDVLKNNEKTNIFFTTKLICFFAITQPTIRIYRLARQSYSRSKHTTNFSLSKYLHAFFCHHQRSTRW